MSTEDSLKIAKENLERLLGKATPIPRQKNVSTICQNVEIIAIGVSTGGPNALRIVVSHLPNNVPCPIVIVQHMPPNFTKSLAQDLNNHTELNVVEAENDQKLEAGTIYIAPGGKHLRLESIMKQSYARITNDPPINNCKPSVDHLFRSVATEYGELSLGVILTGMGNDGTHGAKLIKQVGGKIIVQNEETCVVYGMPKEPFETGVAEGAYPIEDIAKQIMNRISCRRIA